MSFCTSCGFKLEGDEAYCPKCGSRQEDIEVEPSAGEEDSRAETAEAVEEPGRARPVKRKADTFVITAVLAVGLLLIGGVFFLINGLGEENGPVGSEEDGDPDPEDHSDYIVVGSKEFTEQILLGHITVIALEHQGIPTVDKTRFGGTNQLRTAQEEGQIDLYWEYTGTALVTHLGYEEVIADPEECHRMVKEADLENGFIWLDYTSFNNTYTLLMHEDIAAALDIESISDLAHAINTGVEAPSSQGWVLATDEIYYSRGDGYPALSAYYGFEFEEFVLTGWGETYGILRDGEACAAVGFATEARIRIFNLVRLVDDLQLFQAYNCAPVVRQKVLEAVPEIEDILNPIAHALDDETITALIGEVDLKHKQPHAVAEEWLTEQGFIE